MTHTGQQPREALAYIVRAPFTGYFDGMVLLDSGGREVLAYTDGETPEQRLADLGPGARRVTPAEADQLLAAYYESQKTAREITRERFFDMLGCLPPAQWQRGDYREAFHCPEHLAGPLVSWFVRLGDRFFEVVDDCRATHEAIYARAFVVADSGEG